MGMTFLLLTCWQQVFHVEGNSIAVGFCMVYPIMESLGLRALYFALSFLLWFFGPVTMFVSSVTTVVMLSCHDFKSSDNNQKWPASAVAVNESALLIS
ncbi:hypothetical protein L3X38_026605 [Prunus dulcis]|uniref:Uncharacterized protein n=1 Tax=Prunus dulcis TaxID=3755 RepID=A0AAD4VLC3_PRUDU|nr:hypothetical protein L3X38_026605 [Prunus dulcis]